MALARKAHEAPRLLEESDLLPLRALVGEGALEYAGVLAALHFINRIADLLDVDPEAVPESVRRVEIVRRAGVWVASRIMRRMNLAIGPYENGFEAAREAARPAVETALGHRLENELDPLAARPALVETLRHVLEERDVRSSLDRDTLARVHAVVENALPAASEATTGFHARPSDPVDAFAFVGTRYAYRTEKPMIDALRAAGYDDLGILDLAIAIADANQWARLWRLTGTRAELFRLVAAPTAPARAYASA